MNLQFYLEKLHASDVFKEFMKQNKGAYLCSGFFTMDKEGKDNKRHLDFFVPALKKIFSFKLENSVDVIPIELAIEKIPEKLSLDHDFDFEEIQKLIEEEMKKQGMKNKIQKIILSLQSFDGKTFLVGTVFVSMLGLLKVKIDLEDNKPKIVEFEKKSFFDMVKRGK